MLTPNKRKRDSERLDVKRSTYPSWTTLNSLISYALPDAWTW